MVKPTLKPEPDKKDDGELKDDVKLKEWGILPAAVVIDNCEKEKDKKDAEAALELENLDADIDESPRPFVVKCCACFAVFTVVLIITCTLGSFLYFHYGRADGHKWKGWCSVNYDDDDSGEKREHGGRHGSRDSSEEVPNWLNPRPTGPPNGPQCGQQSEVNLDEQYSRVERPQESDCERITILHDYNTNISAYRLWKSEICYVTWIEQDVLMNPEEFWTNMQDPSYLNQHFNELSMMYRPVLPAIPKPLNEQENGKYGEYLDGPKEFLCEGADTYWIEKIPEEEIEAFNQMIQQVIRELLQLASAADQGDYEEDGQIIDYGGLEEPEWPYGEPGDDLGFGGRWPPIDDGKEHPYRPLGQDGGLPEGRHPGGYPGGHPGGHGPGGHGPGGFHDNRKRRSAEKKHGPVRPYIPKYGKHGGDKKHNLEGLFAEARKAVQCLKIDRQNIKEIANYERLFTPKIIAPCVMQKMQEMQEKGMM